MAESEGNLNRDVLGRVLAVARQLSASADLPEILSAIIDALRDTLDAERATVFEYDSKRDELFTMVAHGVAGQAAGGGATAGEAAGGGGDQSAVGPHSIKAGEIRIPATAGLAGQCAQTKRIINVPDAYADPRFNQDVDKRTGFRTRSILTIPLLGHEGELVGVAQVLNKRAGGSVPRARVRAARDHVDGVFNKDDERIAEALAAQAAVAMRRGRLIEDRMVRHKLERDLELARSIQQSSFPQALPDPPGFDIAAWNAPADRTGGDVYDVVAQHDGGADQVLSAAHDLAIEKPSTESAASVGGTASAARANRVVLLMADATGHGVGPAISATQLRSMLRMAVRLGAGLADIAHHANRQLCDDLPAGRFITAWLGDLDAIRGELRSFSAGQAPLLRYDAARDAFDVLAADAPPFGVVDTIEFPDNQPMRMQPGDMFAVVSDGIFEARNPAGAQFGLNRVIDCLRTAGRSSSRRIIESLEQCLDRFTEGRPADDDRTVIIIKRRNTA